MENDYEGCLLYKNVSPQQFPVRQGVMWCCCQTRGCQNRTGGLISRKQHRVCYVIPAHLLSIKVIFYFQFVSGNSLIEKSRHCDITHTLPMKDEAAHTGYVSAQIFVRHTRGILRNFLLRPRVEGVMMCDCDPWQLGKPVRDLGKIRQENMSDYGIKRKTRDLKT